ncbi:MAG TPA: double zinc ribbon domain-containing protein [Polyangia bacterium]|jgi:ComF family protein
MNASSTPRVGLGGRLWRAALDLIYPARCVACDDALDMPEDVFCGGCTLTLAPLVSACPRCARPSPAQLERAPPCLACLERPPRFTAASAGFEFGGAMAEAIRRLKWRHMPELAPPLGGLLFYSLDRAPADFRNIDLIAPVPLHRRRLRKREFNQAAELAAALREEARLQDAPLGRVALDARALERVRDTPPQTGLDSLQRRENMLDAFRVRNPARIDGKRVLLVDDVMTTGATADACAAALDRAGAAAVLVLTLGRAVT